MKAKKLLKRVMECRGPKKASKKTKRRNNKFLSKLFFSKTPCDDVVKASKSLDKEYYINWVKELMKSCNSTFDEQVVRDNPVKTFEVYVVSFDFYDPQKDPIEVIMSKDVDMRKLVKAVHLNDGYGVDVDDPPTVDVSKD